MYAYRLAEYGAVVRYTGENVHPMRRVRGNPRGISSGSAYDGLNIKHVSSAECWTARNYTHLQIRGEECF